ncbi:MAG: GAF domain-containing protein [Deltaproteobacteria bacterium]|nr:GAF domain-containing protein [Deltaproteobacteria bacterium]
MKDEKPKSSPEGGEAVQARRREFLQIIKRSAEFTEEVLKENERLRFRFAELDSRTHTSGDDGGLVRELMEKVRRLEEEREALTRRFKEVEAENKDFASRYLQIENENNNLLNIYVASYQLHSTLDFQEVLQIITEIILNFVGAECFAVGLVQEAGQGLRILALEGLEREQIGVIKAEDGVVGKVLKSGEPHFESTVDAGKEIDAAKPPICVPLRIKDQTIGVILIYRFLQQKKQLAPVDHELFTLLAGHAATAIFASKLYTDSKRKLNTIQGFLDLMTS